MLFTILGVVAFESTFGVSLNQPDNVDFCLHPLGPKETLKSSTEVSSYWDEKNI